MSDLIAIAGQERRRIDKSALKNELLSMIRRLKKKRSSLYCGLFASQSVQAEVAVIWM
jgi:hypothetical protein